MTAYYNEIDPKAAAWLRELIKQGHIAHGIVDERSIIDVKSADLLEFTQCHFFAGIGVWSYALRQAGFPDDKEVWTGSCPCQPFSTAGKGKGVEDERHLFPELHRLISERQPQFVFGEQVGSKAGIAWLDNVQLSLENSGYTCGAVTFPACSIGSPHQRQRIYWVGTLANAQDSRSLRTSAQQHEKAERSRDMEMHQFDGASSLSGELANDSGDGRESGTDQRRFGRELPESQQARSPLRQVVGDGCESGIVPNNQSNRLQEQCEIGREKVRTAGNSEVSGLSVTSGQGLQGHSGHGNRIDQPGRQQADEARSVAEGCLSDGVAQSNHDKHRREIAGSNGETETTKAGNGQEVIKSGEFSGAGSDVCRPCPTNGIWADADWLYCRDGKWRPVEPGTFPLVDGAAERVGRLRGYGNAIVAEQAKIFIETAMECIKS